MRRGTPWRFMTRAIAIVLWVCTVPAFGAGKDYDNVVIVLDASGSMSFQMRGTNTRRMDAAKAALKEVLARVPEDTQIGLLVFSENSARRGWLYPLGPKDDAKLMKAVDLPVPGGYTPLGAFIKMGADRLLEERKKQLGYGTYRLLIVTDGEANDKDLVEKYAPEVIARGITVDVIGVDMATTHTLATRVHSYRKADDPESLKRAVAEVFAEVSDKGTDAASQEAFDILAGVPDETAAAMLKALSASGNHPIGAKPEAEQKAPPPQPAPAKQTPAGQTGQKAAPPTKSSEMSWLDDVPLDTWIPVFVFLAVLFLLGIKWAGKRAR